VKMILTDEKMNIKKSVSKSYPLNFSSDGKSEQNPLDWWNSVCEGLTELTSDTDKNTIAGIGVGGQMHGLVMLDSNNRVLRPAILWNDTRTGEETDYLNRIIGKEKLQELTGNIAFAGFTAPKILWVQSHEPEIFAKCAKICLPKDYINYMLTGVFSTDVSDASGTLLFDVKNRRWSDEMLKICGISSDMLPAVHESYESIGKAKPELGLGGNITVCAGAGDNAAAAIGTDTVLDGQCNISLGTSGTVFIPCDRFIKTKNPALHSFCHANGKYHLMGCILSAASANKWLVENIFDTTDYSSILPGVNTVNAEKQLYFLPYLAGERCPHNDAYVRGAYIGLSHDTSRADLQNALFEGVSFAIRDCMESVGFKTEYASVCGGGAKSRIWMEILSNILNIRLEIIKNEGPALGGALLAARAAGENPKLHKDILYSVGPDKRLAEIYDKKYEKFKKLYPALKDFFH
ncbi:MAG: xylulokinase, partial [Acutalibacteraceae bacterium]